MKGTCIFLLLAGSAFGQVFSVGFRAGVPFNDFLDRFEGLRNPGQFVQDSHRYLIGPTAVLHLPLGFSVGIDALYRKLEYSYTPPGANQTLGTSGSMWQFPVLVQWAFAPGPLKPFIDAGPSFQHITGLKDLTTAVTSPSELKNDSSVGFTFGAGLQLKFGRLRIEPELRYTRWGADSLVSPLNTVLNINRNQGDLIVGFTF
jgi:opacity protein-like surface antigen